MGIGKFFKKVGRGLKKGASIFKKGVAYAPKLFKKVGDIAEKVGDGVQKGINFAGKYIAPAASMLFPELGALRVAQGINKLNQLKTISENVKDVAGLGGQLADKSQQGKEAIFKNALERSKNINKPKSTVMPPNAPEGAEMREGQVYA
jgi:hypothetical protein